MTSDVLIGPHGQGLETVIDDDDHVAMDNGLRRRPEPEQESRLAVSNDQRVVRTSATLAVCFVIAFAALASASANAAPSASAEVWFLRKGKPVAVHRVAPGLPATIKALLAGPTPLERAKGIGTAIPTNTPLLRVVVAQRIVTVDLGGRFASGFDRASLTDRVGQLIRTTRSVPGVKAVRVRIEGGVPVGLFPGYDLARPVSAPYAPQKPAPPTIRETQQLLVDLGFMAPGGVTGSLDGQTSNAVLGFEKYAGLSRDGVLTDEVAAAIARATRPQPALRKPGHRIEVHLDQQLAFLIDNNRVTRIVHISSGAFGKTPEGSFHVYRKERYSWSVPFKVWLPWASYFTGGVAFHEFGVVPTYAASHGCVRVNHYDAPMLYAFATFDTPVDVFREPGA